MSRGRGAPRRPSGPRSQESGQGRVHTCACVCAPRTRARACVPTAPRAPRPPPGPAAGPAPAHLPEAVVQVRELGQPFGHGGENFFQGLRRGRPAGLREPLEQRLRQERGRMSGHALRRKARRPQTHAQRHSRPSAGAGGGLEDSQRTWAELGALFPDRKWRQGPWTLLQGQPAAALGPGRPSACLEAFSTAPL